ncbi:MAG: hypothetical protein A3D94_13895 [Alphaproteobacteria bacterium RIFCSPHIGHO2_12_FULL_66_14]|jgi:hypothetical protein|nr:MAG: hypothetical protein A3D94_13895 [Alphaproteobacteria bacterium RIFCSPHIGHO2_12_FULL_66_14]
MTTVAAARPWRAWHFVLIAAVTLFVTADAFLLWAVLIAGAADPPDDRAGWTLREGGGRTLYAVSAPTSTTVNVTAIVLACEVTAGERTLQLQLYVDGERPLLPVGARREQLKDDPRLRLEIDGVAYPAKLYFAGDFAVIADRTDGALPALSPGLAERLERGARLMLRFDLLTEKAGGSDFDGAATVELKAGDAGKAIAAVRRRCGQ